MSIIQPGDLVCLLPTSEFRFLIVYDIAIPRRYTRDLVNFPIIVIVLKTVSEYYECLITDAKGNQCIGCVFNKTLYGFGRNL